MSSILFRPSFEYPDEGEGEDWVPVCPVCHNTLTKDGSVRMALICDAYVEPEITMTAISYQRIPHSYEATCAVCGEPLDFDVVMFE